MGNIMELIAEYGESTLLLLSAEANTLCKTMKRKLTRWNWFAKFSMN